MSVIISWLILIYFLVLYGERILSLVRTGITHWFDGGFASYVNVMTILSILVSTVMLIFWNRMFWVSLFKPSVTPDYYRLSITVGVALVGGMLHTEHSCTPIQFGAYGALIAAMVLKTVMLARAGANLLPLWYSLAYLVVFSMAVPVVYPTKMPYGAAFIALEAFVSLVLITCFSLMLATLMTGSGEHLLWVLPTLAAFIGDSVLIAFQWKEGANYFVMAFAVVMIVMFLVGKLWLKI